MTEKKMRELSKRPRSSDLSDSIQMRYGMGLPRNRREVSPKVEVDEIDVTDEVLEKIDSVKA